MNKINVLHLVEDLKIGGLENIIATVVRGIDTKVFYTKAWCLCNGGDVYDYLRNQGFDTEILGMRSHRSIPFYINLCKKLRQNNIHIIHTHGFPAATIGRLAGFFSRVPVTICHAHTTRDHYSRKNLFIEKVLSLCTDRYICCSQAVADLMIRKEKIPSQKLDVIYNAVDEIKFNTLRQNAKKEKNIFVVGCIASLSPHKGHRYLLEAAKTVKEKVNTKVKFVFAGDGIEKDALTKYTKSLGLEDIVDFKGVVSDIPALLSKLDVVVLPSVVREGLGIALIEAMAAGKPVIGTALGGIPEVIEDKENGLLVPPKDSPALANAIISILSNDKMAQEMGNRGREIVKSKFSSHIMINKIENLYTELFNAKCKRK